MNEFVEYIVEILSRDGIIRAKAMFGGYGIYKNNTIIGLIIENELYFKTNKDTEKDYQEYNSEPFSYDKNGKTVKMSYWKVPEEILENRQLLNEFANVALNVSLNSKKVKTYKF